MYFKTIALVLTICTTLMNTATRITNPCKETGEIIFLKFLQMG